MKDLATLVALISSFIAIISTIIRTLIKLLERKNSKEYIVQKAIIKSENIIIEDYFNNLDAQNLTSIKKDYSKIDNHITEIIEHRTKNTPLRKLLEKMILEIIKPDRYKTIKFLLTKIDSSSSQRRTLRIILILTSNYLFYLSTIILQIIALILMIYLLIMPIWIIVLGVSLLYRIVPLFIFITFVIMIVFLLYLFGKDD